MELPIIYVRGFAGSAAGIDAAVDDPFYGFGLGATHVRVGRDGEPRFHQFEGPLLRLLIDRDERERAYQLQVHGNQEAYLRSRADGSVDPLTVWIHRFYDRAASTFGRDPAGFRLEKAAEDLFDLVQLVRAKTGAPRVHLVAHSMGGLICRSMIQRVVPERTGRADGAADVVDRFFTYATPHGGIEFAVGFGALEAVRDALDVEGAAIFGRERMHEYLTPAADRDGGPRAGWQPQEMPDDGFPRDRVFCLVGTDAADYDVARGLPAAAVGARSDGLVQIDNASVPGAHRAFVHRSHSGRYGVVNSEEGYQNLRRFLFGDLQVAVQLCNVRLPGDPDDDIVWQLETQLSVRGVPVVMHEQSTAHFCPVQLEQPQGTDTADTPVPLLTTFLCSRLRPVDQNGDPLPTLRQALRLRLLSIREKGGVFGFFDHLEQTADFEDTLVVDIAPGDGPGNPRVWTAWSSQIPGALRDWDPAHAATMADADDRSGVWRGEVALPPTCRPLLGPQAVVGLVVTARP